MVSVKDRLDAQSVRMDILEKAVAKSAGQGATQSATVGDDARAARQMAADQQATVKGLEEKVAALTARLAELEGQLARQQKKGLETDRSIEQMTNKLEAEIRVLGDQVKKLHPGP